MRKSTVFVSVSLLAALTLGCKEEPKAKPTAARANREPSAPAASAPAPVRERPTLKSDGQSAAEGSGESAPSEGAREQSFPERGQWKAGDRTAFDTNGDGRLDQEEREAMHKARIEDTLKKLDSNGDGAISEAELEGSDERTARRVRRRFERYDLDKDGSISREELEQGMKMRRRFGEDQRRGGFGPGGRRERSPRADR